MAPPPPPTTPAKAVPATHNGAEFEMYIEQPYSEAIIIERGMQSSCWCTKATTVQQHLSPNPDPQATLYKSVQQ